MTTPSIVSDVLRALAIAMLAVLALVAVNGVPPAVATPSRAVAAASFADPSVPSASEALAGVADTFEPAAPTF